MPIILHMKKKLLQILSFTLYALGLFSFVMPAYTNNSSTADIATQQLNVSGRGAYGEDASPVDVRIVVVKIILYFFTFAGIIFVSLVVYAGYSLITSHGEQEKVEKAYHTIRVAVIGLIISLTAYSIANFIGNGMMQNINSVDPAFLN